jgi:hypothetical protein
LDPDLAYHCDKDPGPTFNFDADPDPSFHKKAQNLEKVLKNRFIFHPFWLFHLQIDADPDPAYQFDADPDPAYHSDADPDPTFKFDAEPDQQPRFNLPLGVDVGEIAWLGGEGLLDATLLEEEGGVVANDRPGNVGWNHLYLEKKTLKM